MSELPPLSLFKYNIMEFKGALEPRMKATDFEYEGMTAIEPEILFPDGCIQYLPATEEQIGIYFDTYGCVSFSACNAIEVLMKRKIDMGKFKPENIQFLIDNGYFKDGKINFDDRWLVIKSGTIPKVGNDGATVIQTARRLGLPPQSLDTFDLRSRDYSKNNSDLYYNEDSLNPLSDYVALDFAERFEILYEWVGRDKMEKASKEGVLQVYTKAWYKRPDSDRYYNPVEGSSGHAIINVKLSEFKIFDTYDPFIKQMERIQDFYPLALKINIIEKVMVKPTLKNNTLVQLVSGLGGFGLFLDGKIIMDDTAKILATFMTRNNGKTEGMIKPLLQDQWDLFSKVNLKGEEI